MEWVVDMFHFIKDWWFIIIFFIGLLYGGYKGIRTINDTLVDIKNELKQSNKRFESSELDRQNIWKRLFRHDERMDRYDISLARHEVYIEKIKDVR